jgi:hypothetical protein
MAKFANLFTNIAKTTVADIYPTLDDDIFNMVNIDYIDIIGIIDHFDLNDEMTSEINYLDHEIIKFEKEKLNNLVSNICEFLHDNMHIIDNDILEIQKYIAAAYVILIIDCNNYNIIAALLHNLKEIMIILDKRYPSLLCFETI